MASVKYTFDFEKFHLYLVTIDQTLKESTEKCIRMARSRSGAHNRGGTNTMLVMNMGQQQQLHSYILERRLWGDGKMVPIYGYAVVGYASDSSAKVFTGGSIEVNIKKEGGQNPEYTLSHCGIMDGASLVGTTKYAKWLSAWGGTEVKASQ